MTGADTHPDEQPRDPQALIDLMDESQALRFKQAIVRQAIAFAEEIVAHNPTAVDADRAAIAAARAWLADPTPEREEVPLQILIDAGHAVREDYMPGLQHMLRFPGFPDYGYRLNKGAGTTLNLAGVVASDMRNVRGGVNWTFGMRGIVEHYGRVRGASGQTPARRYTIRSCSMLSSCGWSRPPARYSRGRSRCLSVIHPNNPYQETRPRSDSHRASRPPSISVAS